MSPPASNYDERRTGVTQYLLSVHSVDGQPSRLPEENQRAYEDVDTFNAELQAAGSWVFGGGLAPPATAKVVRVRDGQLTRTDGPFAEGKEQIGGFWVVEAADQDAALALAARASEACREPVEVRAFQGPEG
jgi:hypothetical protein